jgi:hypothetical protein
VLLAATDLKFSVNRTTLIYYKSKYIIKYQKLTQASSVAEYIVTGLTAVSLGADWATFSWLASAVQLIVFESQVAQTCSVETN